MGVGGDDLWNPKLVSFLSRHENLLMQISSSIRRTPSNSESHVSFLDFAYGVGFVWNPWRVKNTINAPHGCLTSIRTPLSVDNLTFPHCLNPKLWAATEPPGGRLFTTFAPAVRSYKSYTALVLSLKRFEQHKFHKKLTTSFSFAFFSPLPHLGFPEEAQCLFSSQKTLKWLLHKSKKRLSKLFLHLQSKSIPKLVPQ